MEEILDFFNRWHSIPLKKSTNQHLNKDMGMNAVNNSQMQSL